MEADGEGVVDLDEEAAEAVGEVSEEDDSEAEEQVGNGNEVLSIETG